MAILNGILYAKASYSNAVFYTSINPVLGLRLSFLNGFPLLFELCKSIYHSL